MTPKKVFEIAKRVYDAYPVTGKEKRGCCTAIAKNEGLRFERVKRLVEEEREKVEGNTNPNEGEEKFVPFIGKDGENHMSLESFKIMRDRMNELT